MASLTPMQGALGHRYAAHLLRRTSYRYTKAKVDEMAGQTAAQAVASLLQLYPLQQDQPIYDTNEAQGSASPGTWCLPPGSLPPTEDFKLRPWLSCWWINEALNDPGIGHRMTFFLHQFNSVAMTAFMTVHYFDYLTLLRWAALGNFKKLIAKMVVDNAMLKYLNNTENSKDNPNENFAREFFELFTIGKGPQIGPGDYTNYTEDDIVQAAKVLTGFRVKGQRNVLDTETNIPRGGVNFEQHDEFEKKFSDKFQGTTIAAATDADGMWLELDAFVNMTFAQPETAKNFCRRLYRFFVSRYITPEIESDIITPLADTFIAGNFEIKPVLEQLFQSQHFFDADDSDNKDEIIGGLIKSPVELALQGISFFELPVPTADADLEGYFQFFGRGVLGRMLEQANMPLFFPPDVSGYPGYFQEPDFHRQWFNASTIVARYKIPTMLLSGKLSTGGSPDDPLGAQFDAANWVKTSGVISDATDPYVLVQDLLEYLLPEETDTDRFNYFYNTVFLDQLPPADWTYEWQNYLSTGDDTEVKIPLGRLINAIMYSAEYQLL
ncbi:MAG: DUF1800 family protein [Haliscomenobacteraceae bacterium CHB4]|nr:DUF1800 family protein [Haliscomenobacteraceae bacterium CHB4]